MSFPLASAACVITYRVAPLVYLNDRDDGALKPLPERLVMELTAHRTLAASCWAFAGRRPDAPAEAGQLPHFLSSGGCLEAHRYMSGTVGLQWLRPWTIVPFCLGRPICRLATMLCSGIISRPRPQPAVALRRIA
jgi:hypothetical protein